MIKTASDVQSDYRKTFIFIIVVFVFEFIGALTLTAGRGFESNNFVIRFILFALFAIFGLVFIFIANSVNKNAGKHVFFVPLHEPEESPFGMLRVVKNPVLLTLLLLIVFTPIFFFLGRFSNTFFSSIPFATQQVSLFSNVWGDSIFPALSENLLMYIPIILFLSANYKLFHKNAKPLFWFNNIITIPLVMAFIWKFFHNVVYGSNEFASFYTFAFGYFGVLITLLTMSFVTWSVLHFLTNFILSVKSAGLLGSDLFFIELFVAELVLILIFYIVLYYTKPVKKRSG